MSNQSSLLQKGLLIINEIVSWCACLTTWSALRHFQNDKGETLPERGLSNVCGPNTNYDCPGLSVPVPKKDSYTNRTVTPESLPLPVDKAH